MATDRDAGFAHADIDTSLFHDPKIIRLSRLDRRDFPALFVVYEGTLLASWREGRRLTAVEAETWVEVTPKRLSTLHEAGLLDTEGRIPEHAWERWFMPAVRRREGKSRGGRNSRARQDEAGSADTISEHSSGIPAAQPSQTDRQSGRQSVSQAGGRAGARDGSPGSPGFEEAIAHAERLTGKKDRPKPESRIGDDLTDLIARHGIEQVGATFDRIAEAAHHPPTLGNLVYGAAKALDPTPIIPRESDHDRTVRELKAKAARIRANGEAAQA